MKAKGFTLIELVITIACISVLLLLANFSTHFLTRKNEGQVIINDVQAAIQFAKIQAVSIGRPLYLVPLDETTLDWANGMSLVQINKNNQTIIHEWQWHHPHWRLTWSGVYSADKIVVSNNPITAISNGQFSLFNLGNQERVVIILNRLGRLRIE